MTGEPSRKCVSLVLVVLATSVSWATAQVDIVVLETGEIAVSNAQFTAGSASDLFIDFRCDGTGNGGPVWLRRFPTSVEIRKPFNQTMTSYDPNSGFLRVFSEYFRAPDNMRDGLAGFQCLRHFQQAAVNVRPLSTLFFTEILPAAISSGQDLSSICTGRLPALPTSSVTVQSGSSGGTSYSYCEVESARGTFRSGSVVVGERDTGSSPDPAFIVQPLNITVQPINGVMRGAFSCSVFPADDVQSITWYSGTTPLSNSDPDVVVESAGGISVLVLDSVGMEQEGPYHCEVVMNSGNDLVSETAYLQYNGTASVEDRLILPPPSSLATSEGDTLLIPCVGSVDPEFDGSLPWTTGSSFGLRITAERQNNGLISCEVGNDRADVNVSVLAPVQFEMELDQEVVRFLNADTSPLLLPCEVSGNPLPTVSFLMNGTPIPAPPGDGRVTVEIETPSCSVCVRRALRISQPMVGDEGVYQCVGQVGQDESTAIVSSSYLNLQFLEDPVISYLMQPTEEATVILGRPETPTDLLLKCSVSAHPIPSLSWTRDGVPASGQQSITGFRESAVSLLIVPVEGLSGSIGLTCTAELMGQTKLTTITITAYSAVMIEKQPQSSQPAMLGDTVTFTCAATSTPRPNIIWYQVQNGMNIELMDNGDNVVISEEVDGNSVSRTLQLRLVNELDFTGYFCRGFNGFSSASSNVALVTRVEPPTIQQPPKNFTAVEQEEVVFTCTASGIPIPVITWIITPSTGLSFTNTTTRVQDTANMVEGRLSFTASQGQNGTTVSCMAESVAGGVTSSDATLIIAGVPSTPILTLANTEAQTATIQWNEPFSHTPITQFVVQVTREGGTPQIQAGPTPSSDLLSMQLSDLRPFSNYTVVVVAVSRAGNSTGVLVFTTLQAAPDAPPSNVVAEAVDTHSIRVSWDPPPAEMINGIITEYVLTYVPVTNPDSETPLRVTRGTEELVNVITPDTAFNFTVVAVTIDISPDSLPVVQRTYPLPPASLRGHPGVPTGPEVTMTTLPITLPSINTSQFSHVWVVAVKLGDTDLTGSPADMFSSNSTFMFYSADLPMDTPYIVSEISASSYEAVSSSVFVLGDENGTGTNNDFPQRFKNGPLQEGTQYSVFVWAFIPAISPSSESVAIDSAPTRQYAVFTSSDFLPSTSTRSRVPEGGGGLTAAEIAGIVIAVLVVFILLPILVVMVMVVSHMWYRRVKKIGPPPTREGSMRFKENRSVATVVSNPATRPDSELQEITPDDVRLPVSVEDFPSHVKKLHANSDHPFSEEYQIITIKSPGLPHLQGSASCNVMKNRYANINAYDETRVHLSFIPGVEGSDFINANYIEGYQKRMVYVAAQGPLPSTVHDFWRMVWEEDSCCIVMLTNLTEKGRVKCHQYWPETGSLGLGDITVSVIDTQELAYYTIRTFRVIMGTERREVKQFHYTGWPDFGVPDHPHPVLAFIRRLKNFKRTTQGPDIIHCSAGVGRTGTLITIQTMMQMIEDEGQVDIFNFILGMRRQRSYLVQTERQYIFIHDAVLELIRIGNTEVSIQNLRRTYKELQAQNPHSETSRLEEEYLKLNSLPKIDDMLFSYANSPLNEAKNRDPHILPLDIYRVRLIMVPGFECSDYINASYVDGYQRRHQYILTQAPMKSTVDDFWRMMWEHSVSCVMMICHNEEKGKEMCMQYWSTNKLRQYGDLFVELTQETTFSNYTMREFSLTNTKINESRVLKHYQYTEWLEEAVPPNSAAIIDLIGVLQKAQHRNGGGPIVLHDSTPIGRAGTFCILSSVLEQLKVEGVVDIFFFIHALRQQQPGLVATFDQYKFCYTSVLEFLDSFDHYSNFD